MGVESAGGAGGNNNGNGGVYSLNRMQPLRKGNTIEEMDAKIKEAASKYEKHFLREMVKAMRSTVHESDLIKTNQAGKIFGEQLDDEYVEKWGDKGGIGLAQVIYDQMVEKMGLKGSVPVPKGPIPFDKKGEVFKLQGANPASAAIAMKDARKPNPEVIQRKLQLQFLKDIEEPSMEVSEVRAPWDGSVLGMKRLDEDESLVELQHDNGMKSQLAFRGTPDHSLVGKNIQAGQRIGLLSPEAKGLFWNVEAPGPDTTKSSQKPPPEVVE